MGVHTRERFHQIINLNEDIHPTLTQVHRLPDFTPCLLQIVINETVPQPTRQAGKTSRTLISMVMM